MKYDLGNKTVVITGCNGQLGTSLCTKFFNAKAIVIGLDIDLDKSHNNLHYYYNARIHNVHAFHFKI